MSKTYFRCVVSSVTASVETDSGIKYYSDSTVLDKVFDSDSVVGYEQNFTIFKMNDHVYYVPTHGLKKIQ